jgi:hypothetical protein
MNEQIQHQGNWVIDFPNGNHIVPRGSRFKKILKRENRLEKVYPSYFKFIEKNSGI